MRCVFTRVIMICGKLCQWEPLSVVGLPRGLISLVFVLELNGDLHRIYQRQGLINIPLWGHSLTLCMFPRSGGPPTFFLWRPHNLSLLWWGPESVCNIKSVTIAGVPKSYLQTHEGWKRWQWGGTFFFCHHTTSTFFDEASNLLEQQLRSFYCSDHKSK